MTFGNRVRGWFGVTMLFEMLTGITGDLYQQVKVHVDAMKRLDRLETKVDRLEVKVDRVLQLLEPKVARLRAGRPPAISWEAVQQQSLQDEFEERA